MPNFKNISSVLTLLFLINASYCLALNDYLINKLPQIMLGLKNNTDDLLAQRRTIDITKQALDELVAKKEINQNQADREKVILEAIFKIKLAEASSYQRAIYNAKRPFQFVYNKITDPNAGYLERFAYGAAAAAGVVITGYATYHGGKYAYSALQDRQKSRQVTPEMKQVLAFNELEDKINQYATTDQEKRELYAHRGFIWDPITNTIKNKDNTFLATDSGYKINGKWISSEEKHKIWDIENQKAKEQTNQPARYQPSTPEISFKQEEQINNTRPTEEWESITRSFKKADQAFDRAKKHLDDTKTSPEQEVQFFKRNYGLDLNPKTYSVTDPKTGVIYNRLTKTLTDHTGQSLSDAEMQVIGRRYYHGTPGLAPEETVYFPK